MKLIVLSEDEFRDIQHFVETGKRLEKQRATDTWIEKALERCIMEIKELEDRIDVYWETSQECVNARSAGLKIYRAWRKGELSNDLMQEFGKALRS